MVRGRCWLQIPKRCLKYLIVFPAARIQYNKKSMFPLKMTIEACMPVSLINRAPILQLMTSIESNTVESCFHSSFKIPFLLLVLVLHFLKWSKWARQKQSTRPYINSRLAPFSLSTWVKCSTESVFLIASETTGNWEFWEMPVCQAVSSFAWDISLDCRKTVCHKCVT